MEVQKVTKTNMIKTSQKENVTSSSVSFAEVMAKKQEDFIYERFQELVKQIEDQGKVLAESRSVEDLRKYKKLVKTLLDDAVQNGMKLTEQRGFSWNGRQRLYKIVKEVDRKLIDLTNQILQKEQDGINLLSTIGEIQGLIINIYT
ncbi:YaaR family protein [Anoxybacteroides tepidamans]|uniref:YaaR family protein n=1 Tax=Anoxybacteroides tepidamans TaxID=265948 RepID=UPI00047FB806|nr:YaaR family protein [Anoxybacillus tepidamans]